MSWEYIRAEDFCDSVRDGTHDTPRQVKNGYKLVTGKHIQNGQITADDAYYISEKDFININKRSLVEQWDVLMAMIGNGLGRSAVVKDVPCYAIKNLALYKIGDEINAKWLHYYLSSPMGQGIIYNSLQGSGQPFISLNLLRNMMIPNPKYNIRKNIVTILSVYDDLIENNQKQIKLLEEAAQRLYKEWFVDLHFPNYEDTEIVDGIPSGWEEKPFSEIFTYVRGKSYTSKELDDKGVLMANLKSIRAFGGYNRNAEKRFTGTYKSNQVLNCGDLVMGVTDMTKERRLVGRAALIPNMCEPMTFSMDLIKLEPISIPKSFLYSALLFGKKSEEVSTYANGTNVLHLKPDSIMNIKLIVPTMDLMIKYQNLFEPIQKKIDNMSEQINLLAEARDRLLPKLMSGEIEV